MAQAVVETEVDPRVLRGPRRNQRLRELAYLQPRAPCWVHLWEALDQVGEPLMRNLLTLHGDRVLQPPLAPDARAARLLVERAAHICVAHLSLAAHPRQVGCIRTVSYTHLTLPTIYSV